MLSENGVYERIIRKRKRKSGDQLNYEEEEEECDDEDCEYCRMYYLQLQQQ